MLLITTHQSTYKKLIMYYYIYTHQYTHVHEYSIVRHKSRREKLLWYTTRPVVEDISMT